MMVPPSPVACQNGMMEGVTKRVNTGEVQSVNPTPGRWNLLGKEHESEPFDTLSSVSENFLSLMHGGLLSLRITRIQDTNSTEN
jgi:hypothetical protein